MTLTVDTTQAGGAVRAAITVPSGSVWTLIGEADGHEWIAARETGRGSVHWLTDPMAPYGVDISYRLEYGSTVEQAGPVTRTLTGTRATELGLDWRAFRGWDFITDLSGRQVAGFIRSHSDARSYGVRSSVLDVGRVPVARYGESALPSGTLTARTSGDSTRVLHDLVMSGRPLVVLHQRSPMGRDSIPLCQRITVTSASDSLAARRSQEDRIWSIGWREARPPWRFAAPVVTYDDVRAAFPTHQDLIDSGLSWAQVTAGDWL
ncbi:MAG: hypothetical protein ACTH02_09535 [Corynebacterium sp.]